MVFWNTTDQFRTGWIRCVVPLNEYPRYLGHVCMYLPAGEYLPRYLGRYLGTVNAQVVD